MKCLGVNIVWCILFLCQCEVSGKSISTYADLRRLVLKKMPWSNRTKPELTKPACDWQQCDKVQNLCNNGGVCVITSDCSLKCRCPKGFTGFFCGVKVPDLVTTISLELTSRNREKSVLAEILKPSSSTTMQTATMSEIVTQTEPASVTTTPAPKT